MMVCLTKAHWETYQLWQEVLQRCHNADYWMYKKYGGRGIVVCKQWRNSFAQFLKDMGDKPLEKTLLRLNPDEDFEPGNCVWGLNVKKVLRRAATLAYNGEVLLL
jgi:hypothetical protein